MTANKAPDLMIDSREEACVMRDQEDDIPGADALVHNPLKGLEPFRVQTRTGFIEKQECWIMNQTSRERDPLALTSGQSSDGALGERVDSEAKTGLLEGTIAVEAMQGSGEAQVLLGGEIGVDERVVRHQAQGRPDLRSGHPLVDNLPEGRLQHGRDDPQQCALAGTVGADDDVEASRMEAGAQSSEGDGASEDAPNASQLDTRDALSVRIPIMRHCQDPSSHL